MKLHLILLAFLQHALCAHQAVDPADLHELLQSEQLNAWVESIAAKRNISKDTVRSNVQATTYHLGPVSKDVDSAGGEHAKLERRQQEEKVYPNIYLLENRNDELTNARLLEYHGICRRGYKDLPGGRYTPADKVWSFWRASGGTCRGDKTVRIYCKLPNEFGPPGWNQNNHRNIREKKFDCPENQQCTLFDAFNFSLDKRSVSWGGCTEKETTDKQEMVNNVPEYYGKVECPLKPGGLGEWEVYAQILLAEGEIDWTLFTGIAKSRLATSHSRDFLFIRKVQWRGTDPDYQPWLKFESKGQRATINMYSHLTL